jgi:hypothetical protein
MMSRFIKKDAMPCYLIAFLIIVNTAAVILLDWIGVYLTPKSTPYAEEVVELQDSNTALD